MSRAACPTLSTARYIYVYTIPDITSEMIAPPAFKGRGGHTETVLIIFVSQVVGDGICELKIDIRL